jgi:hypothetical protein
MSANSPSSLIINRSPIAGPTKGTNIPKSFKDSRSGVNNPMQGRQVSPEFLAMQSRDKKGANNHQLGGC